MTKIIKYNELFSLSCIIFYVHFNKYVLLSIDKYLKQCYTEGITMRTGKRKIVKPAKREIDLSINILSVTANRRIRVANLRKERA